MLYNKDFYFRDKVREYKIIEYMDQFNMYRLHDLTNNKDNVLMKEEDITSYVNKQEEILKAVKKSEEKRIQREKEEKEVALKVQQEKEDYNNCYGYVDNKIALQAGKILKTLNIKDIEYNDKLISRKNFIHELLVNNLLVEVKEVFNANRYSKKKIEGCYKKLKDKKEIRLYYNVGNGVAYNEITKTEKDYINYLIKNNILK